MKPHSRTWQGQGSVDVVPLDSLLAACHANIREAARRESDLRDLRRRLSPDDPRVRGSPDSPSIGYQITRARTDQEHWREYQRHYLQRIAVEGKDAVERIPVPAGELAPPPAPPPPAHDPRLPREPGEDDDADQEDLPF